MKSFLIVVGLGITSVAFAQVAATSHAATAGKEISVVSLTEVKWLMGITGALVSALAAGAVMWAQRIHRDIDSIRGLLQENIRVLSVSQRDIDINSNSIRVIVEDVKGIEVGLSQIRSRLDKAGL